MAQYAILAVSNLDPGLVLAPERYDPRRTTKSLNGIPLGEIVEIINDDATMHNVHALPKANQEFNKMEQVKGARLTHVFTVPEVMVRFKCDVHSWMAAYGGVMPHPFFAVTTADGAFSLTGIPPGKYELAVWTEKLGSSTQSIEIGNSQAVSLNFALAPKK